MRSSISQSVIAVTGANGFIGTHLCRALSTGPHALRRIIRHSDHQGEATAVGDIGPGTDWRTALADVDCIIHTAGRAHLPATAATADQYRLINVEATATLARQAASMGVRRLIFLSSIGVLGTRTSPGKPFDEHSAPAPTEPYAESKLAAERVLSEIAARSSLEVVIVRPPLVYGAGAPGNFARLIDLVRRGVPLPLGRVDSRRSMIGIDNLVDLLLRCIEHPNAPGQRLLVADGQDLATPELVRLIAEAMQRRPRLISVPLPMLKLAGIVSGKGRDVERLTESLRVNISHTRQALDWTPPVPVDMGLRRAVTGYLTPVVTNATDRRTT